MKDLASIPRTFGAHVETNGVYSILFELLAHRDAIITATTGHLTHAMYLNLIKQFDPGLSARLHDEPGYRPYTVSSLSGGTLVDERITLLRGQLCRLRITLLDGGPIWRVIQTHCLEAEPIHVRLGNTDFELVRILTTPIADHTGRAGSTDWQTLATLPARHTITMYFSSPTAFSLSERQFALFPEPPFIWESLLRVWNRYAPDSLHMEKQTIREAIDQHIAVTSCALHTECLHFPTYTQKGFVGRCTYQLSIDEPLAARLTTLAAFAHYAGIGYKTTMGMGQAHSDFGELLSG